MEPKPTRITLFIVLAILLAGVSFTGGIFTGMRLPANFQLPSSLSLGASTQAQGTPGASATPVDTQTLFKPFWQAWDLVHKEYVDQPLDDQKLLHGAISGMLSSLGDPNTAYMDPIEYQQANVPLEGSYEGIGAWVDTTGDLMTIISAMPGSPAEKAGLLSGDKVVAVDKVDMVGKDPTLTLRKVLGPAGTTVVLTIQREGTAQPFDVSIVREKIVIPLVTHKMLDNNIAYLQIMQFGGNTENDVKTALKDLLKNNPKGLILDLRNNPGGYLDSAIGIVSQFIPDGVVMIEDHGNGQKTTFEARPGGLATKIPLVVLVNEGSASASEITAGAIQDRGRGQLVGVTTYGKGTVQSWSPLMNNEGAIKVTIARWLTPNGRQINRQGLTPDVVVKITEDDVKNKLDPQLDKAIEILLALQK